MADPIRVRIGDTLRIEVKVSDITPGGGYPIQVDAISTGPVWLWRPVVEAAEHIPAPKSRRSVEETVLASIRANLMSSEDWGWIRSVPGSHGFLAALSERIAEDLQHDEAPE